MSDTKMFMSINSINKGIKVVCTQDKYFNNLVELNRRYPRQVWEVITYFNNRIKSFTIDLKNINHRCLTY